MKAGGTKLSFKGKNTFQRLQLLKMGIVDSVVLLACKCKIAIRLKFKNGKNVQYLAALLRLFSASLSHSFQCYNFRFGRCFVII